MGYSVSMMIYLLLNLFVVGVGVNVIIGVLVKICVGVVNTAHRVCVVNLLAVVLVCLFIVVY